MNPPLPKPSKTIVMGNTQQIVEPNDVERLIKPGFRSENCMMLRFIFETTFVKESVTKKDGLSVNKTLSVPA